MRRTIVLSLGAAATLVSGVSADAAAKRPVKRAAAPVRKLSSTEVLANQLAYNSRIDGESLAQACRTSSFKNLAIALNMNSSWLTAPKGEFETSEEYSNRLDKVGSAIGRRQLVICEPLDDNEDVSFNYQADEERFAGSFSPSHNVWRDVKQLGTYRSKTRMGIPATIKASLEMEYDVDLRVPTSEAGCAISNSSTVSFSVPATRAAAPGLKRSGYLVTMGHLVAPYIREDKSPGEPTLDNPYDVYTSTLTAHLELERLAIIDGAGAEVWTCTPGDLLPSSKAAPRTEPEKWLSIIDYPSGALAARLSGVATVQLKIAADGSIADCTLTGSTGSTVLDEATCPAVQKKVKFTPAADAQGKAIPGEYSAKVPWKWPF